MIRAVYRPKGREDWADMTDDIREETVGQAIVVVNAVSHRLLSKVQQNLSRPGGGKPAPAGDPPARQTGELQRAFRVIPATRSKRSTSKKASRVYGGIETEPGWRGIVRTLEYGATIDGVHHPARPFIRPAEAAVQSELDRMMERQAQ